MPNKVNTTYRSITARMMLAIAAASCSVSSPVIAAKQNEAPPPAKPSYARVADLVTASPAIAVIAVRKMTAVPAERAPGLGPGRQRFLVAADTLSLIRSNDVLARQSSFLLDLPAQPKGKPPKWAKRSFLLFGRVEDRVDYFQLLSSDAIVPWSADNEAFVRKVAGELRASDAAPAIEGVDSVFHVTGAIAGEGETQIFLTTADGSPISLSVIRKPDEQPHFGVSLGEVVDDAAALPERDTPLWYRLACFLPARIPAKALEGQQEGEAAAAAKDYAEFLKAIAPCNREALPVI